MGGVTSLAVWAGDKPAGILAREGGRDYVFAYSPEAAADAQVSLTMPVRLESWLSRELHPIFQTGSRICAASRPWGPRKNTPGAMNGWPGASETLFPATACRQPRSSFSRPWCCQ
jgi:hypothetical protein